MKRFAFILVIAIMTFSMAVVSCKKEDENKMNNKTELPRTFDPRQIEDMNAYLQDFKQKMLSGSKDDEGFSLEEAAWHLASLANYDFAKANEDYNNLRFDTLIGTIKVTEDVVLLSDLAIAYDNIIKSISEFEKSIMLVDKGIYFINVAISEQGEMSISIITTFTDGTKFLEDTCYYFEDWFVAYSDCYNYFEEFSALPVQSTGTTELQRVINLIGNEPPVSSYYFTPTTSEVFYFNQNFDPYGSPSLWNSRLFASKAYFSYYDLLLENDICYYLDSYLGLGIGACPEDEYIVGWTIELKTNYFPYYDITIQRHELTVSYGEKHYHEPSPGGGDLN